MQIAATSQGSKTQREQINSSSNLTKEFFNKQESPVIDSFFKIEKPSGRKLTFDEN
jgi:hypothetical protein